MDLPAPWDPLRYTSSKRQIVVVIEMDQLGGLDVGTVPIFKMHNVGTVSKYKTHNVGTVPTFKMQNVGTVSIYRD